MPDDMRNEMQRNSGAGRPAKHGKAMSGAERLRQFRARKKAGASEPEQVAAPEIPKRWRRRQKYSHDDPLAPPDTQQPRYPYA
jgi:hypothetical protein